MSRDIVVLSAVRTAIGTYGGSLKDVPPTELTGPTGQTGQTGQPTGQPAAAASAAR